MSWQWTTTIPAATTMCSTKDEEHKVLLTDPGRILWLLWCVCLSTVPFCCFVCADTVSLKLHQNRPEFYVGDAVRVGSRVQMKLFFHSSVACRISPCMVEVSAGAAAIDRATKQIKWQLHFCTKKDNWDGQLKDLDEKERPWEKVYLLSCNISWKQNCLTTIFSRLTKISGDPPWQDPWNHRKK